MQKLETRNTYTPTGIPHTRGNCDLSLNGEETPCVAGLKTASNNSDAALTGFRLFQNGTRIEFPLQKQPLSHRKNTYADTLILQTIYGAGYAHPHLFRWGIRYPCTPRVR
jgi:hypothetical protein